MTAAVVSLPSISSVLPTPASSSSSLPFYSTSNGSFKLPPLQEGFERRGSIMLETASRASHSRRGSTSSDHTSSDQESGSSPTTPTLASHSLPSTSSNAPQVHYRTRPSHSRRESITPKPTAPAFKLVPQPMLDPSKRAIRPTDALVVFPSTAGISQASQRKAKLLIGKDVERYFQLEQQQQSGAKAYAYKVVWERRWSETLVKVLNKVDGSSSAAGERKMSTMEVDR